MFSFLSHFLSFAVGAASPLYPYNDMQTARYKMEADIGKARYAYRKTLAKALAGHKTKVELLLLDCQTRKQTKKEGGNIAMWEMNPPATFFPVLPDDRVSRILAHRVLSSDEIKVLIPLLQSAIAAKEEGGVEMCHYPIHGIRIWDGNEVVFQTSFSWPCGSFYVNYSYPSAHSAHWMFVPNSKLQNAINQMLPVPRQMSARFKKVSGLPPGQGL